jgi:Zn-finger nucleic acid-binding protein
MNLKKLGKVDLDECPQCNGIWFDKAELEDARDEIAPDLRWMDFEIWNRQAVFDIKEIPPECPRCRKVTMRSINYREPNINITFCPFCEGVWLNAGDFKNIIDALNAEAAQKSVSEYVKASLKEAGDLLTHPGRVISEWRDLKAVLRMLRYRVFLENPEIRNMLVDIQKSLPL